MVREMGAFALALLLVVVVSGCTGSGYKAIDTSTGGLQDTSAQPGEPGGSGQLDTLPLRVREPSGPEAYSFVTEMPSGTLKTGQEAGLVLYATRMEKSGGPTVLNHPGKVASDGKRLIVSDTWNNRVLVWNGIPSSDNQKPDLVLGQPNFETNKAGLGASGMNWPMGVATDGNKLIVGDAYNDRVLIWNSFPTSNGQPADLVLGAPGFGIWPEYRDWETERDPMTRVYWPWDVWTDGKRLVVASTGSGGALAWKAFPTRNNQPADYLIGVENFSFRFIDTEETKVDPMAHIGGARAIASDGETLVIGTYQPQQAYVWNEFPTESGIPADFILTPIREEGQEPDGVMGADIEDGKLYATSSHHVFVWDSVPQGKTGPDKKLGMQRTRDENLYFPDKYVFHRDSFNWPYDVEVVGQKMVVADTNHNRVLVFNSVPESPEVQADVSIGEPGRFVSRGSFGSGPAPFSNGEKLAIGVDGFGVWIYNKIPDQESAEADVVLGKLLGTTVVGGPAILAGEKLIMAHREGSSVFIWNTVPEKDDTLPDVVLGKVVVFDNWGSPGKGRFAMSNPAGIASDGQGLFVADTGNNRILAWNKIPEENQTPADFVLGQPNFEETSPGNTLAKFDGPTSVSVGGKRLVVVDGNGRVLVWKSIPTKDGQPADFEIKVVSGEKDFMGDLTSSSRLSLPVSAFVYGDSLFVADNGNNRVLIWSKFPENGDNRPDIIIGQKDIRGKYPSNSRDGLFIPANVNFDGSFLWVGEMKWSNRLLRFSVSP